LTKDKAACRKAVRLTQRTFGPVGRGHGKGRIYTPRGRQTPAIKAATSTAAALDRSRFRGWLSHASNNAKDLNERVIHLRLSLLQRPVSAGLLPSRFTTTVHKVHHSLLPIASIPASPLLIPVAIDDGDLLVLEHMQRNPRPSRITAAHFQPTISHQRLR
jgi:hypothetical protein